MFPAADLTKVLPIFPLSGALLLPRARLPLHIFEPRYLAMFDDALKTPGRLIGMIQPLSGGQEDAFHDVGCAGRVTSFTETEDGRYMVTLTGVSRFRIGAPVEGFAPYLRNEVDWGSFTPDLGKAEQDPDLDRKAFLDLLVRYFEVAELETDWESLKEAETELLINALSALCPFAPEDKQALLEAPSLAARRKVLVTLMEFVLKGGTAEKRMQ